MALTVALPSGLEDILDGFALLSPILPSCTDSRENFKTVVSPFGSESSSGVSSFDADEIKKSSSLKDKEDSNDNDNNEIDNDVDDIINEDIDDDKKRILMQHRLSKESQLYHHQHQQDLLFQGLQMHSNETAATGIAAALAAAANAEIQEKLERYNAMLVQRNKKIMYNNRDILDLSSNLQSNSDFIKATHLENNYIKHFFENRSQLYRLGAKGTAPEYVLGSCDDRCCDFMYPITEINHNYNNHNVGKLNNISIYVDGVNITSNEMDITQQQQLYQQLLQSHPLSQHSMYQQQQQHQHQKMNSPITKNNINFNQNAINNNSRYANTGNDFINSLFSQNFQQIHQHQQNLSKNGFMNNTFNNFSANVASATATAASLNNVNNINGSNNNNNMFNSNYGYANNNGNNQINNSSSNSNGGSSNRWNDYALFKQNKLASANSNNNNINNYNRYYNANNMNKNNYNNINNYNFGNTNAMTTASSYKHF